MRRAKNSEVFMFDTTSPKKSQRACDCSVRAISLAMSKPWLEVYDALCELGRKYFRMPNEDYTIIKYIEQSGWQKMPMPRTDEGKRLVVREFCKRVGTTAIVRTSKHLTCIKDGKIHDTWDCSGYAVGVYYIKKR